MDLQNRNLHLCNCLRKNGNSCVNQYLSKDGISQLMVQTSEDTEGIVNAQVHQSGSGYSTVIGSLAHYVHANHSAYLYSFPTAESSLHKQSSFQIQNLKVHKCASIILIKFVFKNCACVLFLSNFSLQISESS